MAAEQAPTLWDVRAQVEANFRRVEALAQEMQAAHDPRMRLAALSEMRRHLTLALETLETTARTEAVRAFEETVMEALASADATVRQRVVEALHARAGTDPGLPGEAGAAIHR